LINIIEMEKGKKFENRAFWTILILKVKNEKWNL
jgi:hypothetical protein